MSARIVSAMLLSVVLGSTARADDAGASSLVVTGRGIVSVVPDRVSIDITLATTDDDLLRVRESSDQDARAIITLAKEHGVEEQSGVEVTRLELSLDFNEQLRRQIYQVERDLTLTLADLGKLDGLLSGLLAGRNAKVVGIRFVAGDERQHEFEALRRAVADAKEKATHLAALTDQRLGRARHVQVVNESQRPFVTSIIPIVGGRSRGRGADPFGAQLDGDAAAGKLAADASPAGSRLLPIAFQQANAAAEAAAPFALGTIEVSAEVRVDYEFAR